jgi:very-short-patch-repair endonuclease
MARQTLQALIRAALDIAKRQHWVITRRQLLDLGFSAEAIDHRIETGWLYPIHRGVFSLGRPQLSRFGSYMAGVLACGPAAALSHDPAAALWGIRAPTRAIDVVVPAHVCRRHPGIRVHRRAAVSAGDVTIRHGIPVMNVVQTLIDIAAALPRNEVEAALNEADLRGLIAIEALRTALDTTPRRPGLAKLRTTIDRRVFTFTRSELERRFLRLVRRAGLPKPLTRVYVNGFEVDFYWPELGLVIETDGGTFHRTPAQQAADRRRDQTHTAAGLTPLRFTHGQIMYEPAYVEETLTTVALRLSRPPA